MKQGYVQVYTGNGKGKATAAWLTSLCSEYIFQQL